MDMNSSYSSLMPAPQVTHLSNWVPISFISQKLKISAAHLQRLRNSSVTGMSRHHCCSLLKVMGRVGKYWVIDYPNPFIGFVDNNKNIDILFFSVSSFYGLIYQLRCIAVTKIEDIHM